MHLNNAQIRILEFIDSCGYAPTITEITKELKVSRNHVTGLLNGSILSQNGDRIVQYYFTCAGLSWYKTHKSNFETTADRC